MISRMNDTHGESKFYYIPKFMNETEEKELLKYLDSTCNFVPTPQFTDSISRLQKWYQKDKKYFCPLWKNRFPQWESFELDETLTCIFERIQKYVGNIPNLKIPTINSCLINKYPDGKHFIAPHRDSSASFGEEPTIINLSLGVTRKLVFQNENEQFSFDLESGSLFIMGGASQKTYLHSIQKADCPNVRYSLTFREFIL